MPKASITKYQQFSILATVHYRTVVRFSIINKRPFFKKFKQLNFLTELARIKQK